MTTQIFGNVIQATLQGAGFGLAAKGFQSLGTAAGSAKAQMDQVTGTGAKLRGALGGIGKFLTGPAGLALGFGSATTALVAFSRGAVNAADELGKAATRTGLSVEALSSLEVAARQGGTSFSTLEQGLARFARNAVDASSGIGEASRGFDRLGISVTDANGELKSTEQLYSEVVTELSELEGGATKAATAQELFGRGGAKLIPVLNSGADALTNNVTTSEELARSSEALNDRMDDIRVIFGQAGRAVLTGLVPPLARLLTSVVAGAKELRERFAPAWTAIGKTFQEVSRVVGIVVTHVGQNLFGVLKSVGNFLNTLFGPAINAVQAAFRGLGKDTPTLGRALSGLAAFFVTVSGRVTELTQRIIGGATAALRFSQTIGAILRLDFSAAKAAYEGIGEAWATAAANADATRQRTDEAAAAIRDGAKPAAVEFEGVVGDAAKAWGGVASNISGDGSGEGGGKSVKKAVEEVSEATKAAYEAEGELEAERFARVKTNLENTTVIRFFENKRAADDLIANETRAFTARETLVKNHEEILKKQTDNHLEELKKIEPVWKSITDTLKRSVQGAITGLINGTKSWSDALSNIANSVLNSIINKFSELATNSIFNLFTGGKTGGLGSIFRAGAGAAAGAAGKALAGAGAGAAGAGKALGGAAAGAGKVLGGIGSAIVPVAAIGAGIFGASKLLGGLFGGSGEGTKRAAADFNKRIENTKQLTDDDKEFILARASANIRRLRDRNKRNLESSSPLTRQAARRSEERLKTPTGKVESALFGTFYENLDDEAARAFRVSLSKNVDKFRLGGIVGARRGGQLILAGEGGRNEAVVPLPGGRAIPVEFRGRQPGGTVNITINIDQATAAVDSRSSSVDAVGLEQRLTDWALTNLQPGGIFAGMS